MGKFKLNKKFFGRLLRIILWVILGFLLLSFLSVLLFKFVNPPFSPLMIIRAVEQKFDGKPMQIHKKWVSIDNISPNLLVAVISSEDNKFLEHHGFDWDAIKQAYDSNKKGRKVKGASTISQQTAKNVFLWPSRSYIRKGFEAYFTFLIELMWSKKRILEVYLNIIEMGDGVYGAEEASMTYYKKPASRLSVSEAAAIASILPNPRLFNPVKPSARIALHQRWIINRMAQVGRIKFK
ncbi:MAG: monofunctional biosynthetic peptidoglycan transglycosylase [Bacteroidota bacterium]